VSQSKPAPPVYHRAAILGFSSRRGTPAELCLSVALLVDAYAGDDLHGRNEMAFDRANFDAFWDAWLDINRRAQETRDWGIMASFYEPDASYGWSYSPTDHFMANGRDEIRDLALGTEMLGFQGWIYPYQGVIFDDRSGQAFGLWRQLTTFKSPSGEPYEIKGPGASWFQYSRDHKQRCRSDMVSRYTKHVACYLACYPIRRADAVANSAVFAFARQAEVEAVHDDALCLLDGLSNPEIHCFGASRPQPR
jgi:hypothetical protein